MNQFSKLFGVLSFVAISAFAGCNQESAVEILAHGPDTEAIAAMGQNASDAIDATGGSRAWMETTQFSRKCIVTFYKSDDTYYLTQQQHRISPWANAVSITAAEPQGKLTWKLSRKNSQQSESCYSGTDLPGDLPGQSFAEAILDITTAPVRSLYISTVSGPTKIQNRWYYEIERPEMSGKCPCAEAIFRQDTDTSLINTLWLKDLHGDGIVVRGYDYEGFEQGGILVPAKIEIFTTDSAGNTKDRLVTINYY